MAKVNPICDTSCQEVPVATLNRASILGTLIGLAVGLAVLVFVWNIEPANDSTTAFLQFLIAAHHYCGPFDALDTYDVYSLVQVGLCSRASKWAIKYNEKPKNHEIKTSPRIDLIVLRF